VKIAGEDQFPAPAYDSRWSQRARPERSHSSIPSPKRSWSSGMRSRQGKPGREANRLSSCAPCNQPFAVCGRCDRGRLHCSRECAQIRRHGQLRRAGRRYQATERGRAAHALRQARYRARRARVTHPPEGDVGATVAQAAPASSAAYDGPPCAKVLIMRHGALGACMPPACAYCRASSGFLRNGFRPRARRRIARSPPVEELLVPREGMTTRRWA
jgi:hypothetical protein